MSDLVGKEEEAERGGRMITIEIFERAWRRGGCSATAGHRSTRHVRLRAIDPVASSFAGDDRVRQTVRLPSVVCFHGDEPFSGKSC
jgi:hypothetical protein